MANECAHTHRKYTHRENNSGNNNEGMMLGLYQVFYDIISVHIVVYNRCYECVIAVMALDIAPA